MKGTHISRLVGTRLPRDLYGNTHNLKLLTSGMLLTSELVEKLRQQGITKLYTVPKTARDEHNKTLTSNLTAVYNQSIEGARFGVLVNTDKVRRTISDVVDSMLKDEDVLDMSSDFRNHDERTHDHSTDVSILSVRLGMALGYRKSELIHVGTGGLLHDIGKAKIPDEIVNFPGKYTDEMFAVMKSHPSFGYQIMMEHGVHKELYARVAAEHHLPRYGILCGDKPHVFSEITKIADIYCALTEERCYRSPMPSKEVLDFMVKNHKPDINVGILRKLILMHSDKGQYKH